MTELAKKRKAFIHVGMPGVGDFLGPALAHHSDALRELGVHAPAKHSQESFRAAVEITRSHKTWGIERKHVEGTWAGVYRRAQKGRDAIVFSAPLLATAEPEQIDLFLDGLTGFEVHVVVTADAPHAWTLPGDPESDLAVVLDRWERAIRRPERLHVVLADVDPERPEVVQEKLWRAFGSVVGFGTASLGLADVPQPVAARSTWLIPTAPMVRAGVLDALARSWIDRLLESSYDVVGDPSATLVPRTAASPNREEQLDRLLSAAMREIEQLTRRNEALAAELTASVTARRPHLLSAGSPAREGRRRRAA